MWRTDARQTPHRQTPHRQTPGENSANSGPAPLVPELSNIGCKLKYHSLLRLRECQKYKKDGNVKGTKATEMSNKLQKLH